MLEPNYLVLIAPGADAGEVAPDWVDVSPDLQSVEINRGSPSDLDRNNPGTATVVLDNWSGDYDNENADSDYAGDLVPMTQILIYAEHDGELYPRFRGFFDNVALDYPGEGMATATITATDAFKPLAQTELPTSAYVVEVLADSPAHLYRLNEPEGSTHFFDTIAGRDLTVQNVFTTTDSMISREAGSAILTGSPDTGGITALGAPAPITLVSAEAMVRIPSGLTGTIAGEVSYVGLSVGAATGWVLQTRLNAATYRAEFALVTTTGTAAAQGTTDLSDGDEYHVLGTWDGTTARLYVNGVEEASAAVGGSLFPVGQTTFMIVGGAELGAVVNSGLDQSKLQMVAVYRTALSAARAAAHYAAVTTPWNNDTPGERADRVADHIAWPAAMRDFDTGTATLQSADIGGTTALEHFQKIGETDLGAFYASLDGTLVFRGRAELANRGPRGELGDADGEVGYRTITFDSSDETMRNPVTISRAEGVAQTAVDAAKVGRFLDHQYTLDGLLHDSDAESDSMADLILSEFKNPRRRIIGVGFGPAEQDKVSDWYPLLLMAELGDVYDLTFRPPNVAAPFTQRSTLEGTHESWSPAAGHAVSWDLSPSFGGTAGFWELGVVGHSELGVTTRLFT